MDLSKHAFSSDVNIAGKSMICVGVLGLLERCTGIATKHILDSLLNNGSRTLYLTCSLCRLRRHRIGHQPALRKHNVPLTRRIPKEYLPTRNALIRHIIQPLQHAPNITHDLPNAPEIHILIRLEDVPPHRRREHRVPPDDALVVARLQPAPLHEEVLEVLVADGARGDVVRDDHAVLGDVEEVVEEVLVPDRGAGGGEAAEPAGEQVHVQEGDLGPGVEGWGESKT